MIDGCIGLVAAEDPTMAVDAVDEAQCSGKFRDESSGQVLRDDLVQAARHQELKYFAD